MVVVVVGKQNADPFACSSLFPNPNPSLCLVPTPFDVVVVAAAAATSTSPTPTAHRFHPLYDVAVSEHAAASLQMDAALSSHRFSRNNLSPADPDAADASFRGVTRVQSAAHNHT